MMRISMPPVMSAARLRAALQYAKKHNFPLYCANEFKTDPSIVLFNTAHYAAEQQLRLREHYVEIEDDDTALWFKMKFC